MTEARHMELLWSAEGTSPNMTIVFANKKYGPRYAPCILLADENQEAIAALIVKAVNNHQALVDALGEICNFAEDEDYGIEEKLRIISNKARAALKAVQS